ncbi:thiamine diphosphokinase [Empedobacter sedimenti]|uniref:thiamine diphosphokinase n=1 Tax=Empedobacter sedimenti TaxID=3042610 RepID=UPI002A4E1E86|nr:thiamine diphosphokinase [Empedobacter sedimenti]
MNKALLFLNGEVPTTIPDTTNYDTIFCTDGAFRYLQKLNITPDVISGDFDSFEISQFPPEIEIISTPDQNDTDFAKALTIIKNKGFNHVDVFGASGRQQDHFIGNLNAAYRFKDQLNITFYDNYSKYFFAEKSTKLEGYFGRTISLIPFPECKNITTNGLEYPLNKENLNLLSRIGTRNKANQDIVTIEYTEGALVLFIMDEEFPILIA